MRLIQIDPKKLIQTCTACPSQWEGHLEDGRMVYIRYRHDHFTLEISRDPVQTMQTSIFLDLLLDIPNLLSINDNGYLEPQEMHLVLIKHGFSATPNIVLEPNQKLEYDESALVRFLENRKGKND